MVILSLFVPGGKHLVCKQDVLRVPGGIKLLNTSHLLWHCGCPASCVPSDTLLGVCDSKICKLVLSFFERSNASEPAAHLGSRCWAAMHALWKAGGTTLRHTLSQAAAAPATRLKHAQLFTLQKLVSLRQFGSLNSCTDDRHGGVPTVQAAAAPRSAPPNSQLGNVTKNQIQPENLANRLLRRCLQCSVGPERPAVSSCFSTKAVPAAVQGVPVLPASQQQPADVISKELQKGPTEMPFAAKAYYLGERWLQQLHPQPCIS